MHVAVAQMSVADASDSLRPEPIAHHLNAFVKLKFNSNRYKTIFHIFSYNQTEKKILELDSKIYSQ
jgi:hypothetical protein